LITSDVTLETVAQKQVKLANPPIKNSAAITSANGEWLEIKPGKPGTDPYLILDFGREVVGFTEFEALAEAGTVLDLYFFEGYQEGKLQWTPHLNNSFRYICRTGRQQFRTFHRRGFRYGILTIRNLKGTVKLRNLSCVLNTYPVSNKGSFSCSDVLLGTIWDIGAYTLRLCMEDTFVDCPAYEQTHWVGDARNEALIDYTAFGDTSIARRCIEQVADSMRFSTSGLPQSHVPSGWDNILTAWAFLWMIGVEEYYTYTGDKVFIRKMYPELKKTCEHFLKYVNQQNLLEIEAWNMLDWAPMDTAQKLVTHNQAFFVRSLETVARLAELIGKEGDAKFFLKKSISLKQAINKHLWSSQANAFIDSIHADGSRSSVVSQQTNTIMLLCNCTSSSRAKKLERFVISPPDNVVKAGSPFFMFFWLEALVKIGRLDLLLPLIREKWGFMVEQGATTFWENLHLDMGKTWWTRSYCHAWSAAPTYFLSRYILGVQPVSPGCREVLIQPYLADLTFAKGNVPTLAGSVQVEYRRTKDSFAASISLPRGVKGVFEFPEDLSTYGSPHIKGRGCRKKTKGKLVISLSSGSRVWIETKVKTKKQGRIK